MATMAGGAARPAGSGPDLSGPALPLPLVLGLVCLPIGWIAAFAFSDRGGAPTLGNFAQLLDDPTLTEPLLTTLALSFSVATIAGLAAAPLAWLVARTDMPGRRIARVLMTASFVTPPFLGAIAWEILAAPNSGILNRIWRDLSGASEPLLDIYSFGGLVFVISCYTAPYVFVVLANALDRIPADLEDAAGILGAPRWRIVLGITLPPGDDALRLAGNPRDTGRFPHHHDEDLLAVPVPAQAAGRRGGGPAAAAGDGRAAVAAVAHPRPSRLRGHRRQGWRASAGGAGRMAPGRRAAAVHHRAAPIRTRRCSRPPSAPCPRRPSTPRT